MVKLDVLCFLHWLPWAHFRLSNACNFLISGQKHKVWVFIFLVRSKGNFWWLNCQDSPKFSLFLLLLLWFQFWPSLYIMQRHHWYDTMCEHAWRHLLHKNVLRLKLYIIKRKFKFLEWICHLFHLVKRKMYISFVASPLMKYGFFPSLDEINGIFIPKIWISSMHYEYDWTFFLFANCQVDAM